MTLPTGYTLHRFSNNPQLQNRNDLSIDEVALAVDTLDRAWDQEMNARFTIPSQQRMQRIKENLVDLTNDTFYILIEDNAAHRIIGYGLFNPATSVEYQHLGKKVGLLTEGYVLPEARNLHIFTGIVQEIDTIAQKLGYTHVVAELETNRLAQGALEKVGYRVRDTEQDEGLTLVKEINSGGHPERK